MRAPLHLRSRSYISAARVPNSPAKRHFRAGDWSRFCQLSLEIAASPEVDLHGTQLQGGEETCVFESLEVTLQKVPFGNSQIMIWQDVKTRFDKLVLSGIRTRPGRNQPIWMSVEIQISKRLTEGRSLWLGANLATPDELEGRIM